MSTDTFMDELDALLGADLPRPSRDTGGDQAHGLRLLVRSPSARAPVSARTLAIASGKGGVGKTFLATNLAVLAARRGTRVLLIDGDLGLANVDTVLATRAQLTAEDVIDGRASLRDALVTGPSGVKILAGGSGIRSLAQLDGGERRRMLDELSSVQDEFDLVIVDCGAGIGENVMFFAAAAASCVLTINAEPTSLIDAYAAAKAMSQVGIDTLDVVVNCALSEADARDSFGRLATVVGRFLPVRLRYAGSVPRDDAVRRAVMSRRPLVDDAPNGRAAAALHRIERSLAEQEAAQGPPARVTMFWDRLFAESAG